MGWFGEGGRGGGTPPRLILAAGSIYDVGARIGATSLRPGWASRSRFRGVFTSREQFRSFGHGADAPAAQLVWSGGPPLRRPGVWGAQDLNKPNTRLKRREASFKAPVCSFQ